LGYRKKPNWHRKKTKLELIMRNIALAVAFLAVLIATATAQKAEIEAANVKWMEFFGKGDFDGVASLYTVDATAFPPGSGMVRGRVAIGAMWKSMAEQVSDPKVTTLDVKRLGPSAARERVVGEGWKRLEAFDRYLE
jgi:SnoaL-like domain